MNKTDIANLALSRIGEQIITNLDGTDSNSRRVNLVFTPVLEQVIRNHNWKCCTYRQMLAETVSNPLYGFEHSYQLPTDPKCVRAMRLHKQGFDWTVEGGLLHTDLESAGLTYLGLPNDYDLLDSSFVKVLYLSIAVELAFVMTENNTVLSGLKGLLDEAWDDARFNDSAEGTVEFSDRSPLILARSTTSNVNYDTTNIR